MSTQQPGRLPASVYRRRRIVVGLAVLAVIVVIVLLFIPRGGSGDDGKVGAGDSQSPAPTDTETTSADGSAPCDPAVITLTAVTDKTSYAAGETPMISMTIVNSGASACTFDVGTDAQLYEIVSGSDPIWNSRDCQSDPQPLAQVLEPGVELSTTPFAWDRTRSSADTCDSDRSEVTAGGATYRLSVSLGEAASESDTPFLLN
ncbi:hypothetical protein [Protaetiibacter mangrovi]|uniref:DUF4232 domain-containing protein n=1 Tax=Protaetiibacter mangrovi TaxID=2970926 RepID=A0ABT1ZCS9_9MICO|nr:hypothetical protein [Protaetiibacter mangrovi]MCS0498504.1 hypothetical protein [Protaetiibacter mangrovi]